MAPEKDHARRFSQRGNPDWQGLGAGGGCRISRPSHHGLHARQTQRSALWKLKRWGLVDMRRIITIFLGFVVLSARPLRAATEELQRAVLRPEHWTAQRLNVADRKYIAERLVIYWRALSDRIPRLPPAERRWIEGELNTTDSSRLAAALNRKEGALYMAADAAEFCLTAYEALSKRIGIGKTDEALAWVHSLRCYSSTNDLPIHLFKAGLITTPRWDAEIKLELFSIWSQMSLKAIESTLLE